MFGRHKPALTSIAEGPKRKAWGKLKEIRDRFDSLVDALSIDAQLWNDTCGTDDRASFKIHIPQLPPMPKREE